jgi:WD40 repeat protein/energy-coupling factor transporter ATP-binding protein EcfA2
MARYAFVVGISKYDNFRNLEKAATDAAALARIFQTHGQYQVEPLPKRLVEAENRWELAIDKKLTGKDLGQALETFLLERAKDQEALIYFAGHGFEVPGLGRRKKGYLATSDCTSDGRNAILFSDLNDLIRESSLSNLVLILDCCHAGSFLERTMLESTLTAFKEKKDYYLITACRDFERAREGEEHGIFTAAVLKGLQRNNADSEGTVTGDRLFDFVQRELRQSGQEPIRTGTGRSITLVSYQPQAKTVTAIVDERSKIVCPYQGLQAFTAMQREFFFGRKRIVETIKQKLEQQTFVPVIGASGSGKSSVVRAGLMPWLEECGWQILEPIKPGFEPLAALRRVFEPFFKRSRLDIQTLHQLISQDATELSSVTKRLPSDHKYLLVVDQFEEVFTICTDETERQRFIELITQVAEIQDSRLAVVTTMRADFLEPCLRYPSLHHLIQSQAVFMPPLTGVDLRDAITEPAKRQGYAIEETLLLQILEEVGKEAGFLPLLEFSLTKLWEKRDQEQHLLTLEQYERLGGLTGTLNLHAERVYQFRDYEAESPSEPRNEQEQEWIKRIFLRLVRTGEGEKDTRQRQLKANLLAIAVVEQHQELLRELLDGEGGLVQGRLLVVGEDEQNADWIDLVHEALIGGWQRFVGWRKKDRDLRRLSDRLRDALRQWQTNLCDNELMMGGLLVQIRENWQILEPELDSLEQEFYRRSVAYEQDQITQLQQALSEAKQRQIEVEKSEIKALCKSSEAFFALNEEFDALLESLRAATKLKKASWIQSDNVIQDQVITALQQAAYWVREKNRFHGHTAPVQQAIFSPDGQLVASASEDHTLELWRIDGTLLANFNLHSDEVMSVSFSPNGQLIASASKDKTVKLWHLDGSLEKTLQHECELTSVSFSSDGQKIVVGCVDHTAKLWHLDGTLLSTFIGHKAPIFAVSFSSDNKIIASASDDHTIKIWNTDGSLLTTLIGHNDIVTGVVFSPDCQTIASASWDRTVKIWQTDGTLINTLSGHKDGVQGLSFSPDGQMLASASKDKSIKVWKLDGTEISTFVGHSNWVNSVNFHPSEPIIISASGDNTIKLWSLKNDLAKSFVDYNSSPRSVKFSSDNKIFVSANEDKTIKLWYTDGGLIQTIAGHNDRVWCICFNSDNSLIASGSLDKTIKIWTIDGLLLNTFVGHIEGISSLSFSPNNNLIASGSWDGTIKLWRLDGTLVNTFNAHKSGVKSISFNPDGQIIISGGQDKIVKVWRVDGTLLNSIAAHRDVISSVDISPNGQVIASASEDGTIKIWNLTGVLIETFQGHTGWIQAMSFSPDGRIIASGGEDKTIILWELNGRKIATLKGHQDWIRSICFSSNGKMIVSVSADSNFILWDIEHLHDQPLEHLLAYSCRWVRDYLRTNLSVQESDRHLCDEICE